MRNVLLGAAVLILGGACQDDLAESTSEFSLAGVVVDERSGDGVANAKVTFISDTLDRTQTSTDGAGRFAMEVIVAKDVRFGTLRVERDGYQPLKNHTVYFDGTQRNVELSMRPTDP